MTHYQSVTFPCILTTYRVAHVNLVKAVGRGAFRLKAEMCTAITGEMAKQRKMNPGRALPAQVQVTDTPPSESTSEYLQAAQEPAVLPLSEAHLLLAKEAEVEPAGSQVNLLAQVKQLQAQLRSAQYDGKMHKDAWTSAASKYDALSAKID